MFIGIDCGTQSLKLLVINELKQIQKEIVVVYDVELPAYKTLNGVIRHNLNHVSTPSKLFVEALELAIQKLRPDFDLFQIKGISSSGQQHGSIYFTFIQNQEYKSFINK